MKHDLDMDYTITAKNPTTTIVESPTIAESPTTIAESPMTAEIPILNAPTGRKDGSVLEGRQTEGCRYIASRNEVPLSAVFQGSKTEGRGGIAKVPLSEPLWARRFNSKLDKLAFTQLHILNCLEALDKKVDGLEITGNGVRDAIKGAQDDILGLQRAKDETLMYIDERLEKPRKGSTTRRGDISISVHFPEG
ncbi:MAG: hypothetical protein M1839_002225 [Geoglossum umbratile]|nr:MAG: hypothetical protein M1839_002225 [Geoglossum umbratile]